MKPICARCPASNWGATSYCKAHERPVGEVKHCDEWRISTNNLEPSNEIIRRVEDEIRDYGFMIREIERLRKLLGVVGDYGGTKFGVEATLPKPQGITSDKVGREVVKRDRLWNRLDKLAKTVQRIDKAMDVVKDERERAVLECLIDGVRANYIARHIGVSRQRFYMIKRALIKKMACEMYAEELTG